MPKRILVISPTPTHPPISGNRARIATLLSNLEQMGHAVHFLHVERESGDRERMREIWGNAYHRTPYRAKATARKKMVRKLKGLVDADARFRHGIDDWWDESASAAILDLHARHDFDVAIAEYAFFSKALTLFGDRTLKIIDTHDVFTDRHRLYLKNGQRPRWYSTSRKEEAKALNRADLVLAIQDDERQYFEGLTATPVITVGHAVELEPPSSRELSHTMLYVAGHNPINVSSGLAFIEESFDLIRSKVPDAQLLVAGTVCDALPDLDGIIKLGVLDDLGDAYRRCDVVINPMRYGTGLKIKTIEPLGRSKPVVTTRAGAMGLEAGEGKAFLVADDFRQFAEHVVALITDGARNAQISEQAFQFASLMNASVVRPLELAIGSQT